MSCRFGSSPRPFTTAPVSSSAVSLEIALPSPCSAATSSAITTPAAFTQGPVPMRSRALTVLVERYAAQVLPATPAASARDAQ